MNIATIDFETRSAKDIKHGGWAYSEDPTTEVLCLAFHLPGDAEARLWHPAFPAAGLDERGDLTPLFDHIAAGGIVEAHNAAFERAIWENVCVARMGWPAVNPAQWRCSASVCASLALPRSLGAAADALGLPMKKDSAGNRVMLKIAKPRGILKADLAPLAESLLGDATRWQELRRTGDTIFKLRERHPGQFLDANPWHEKADEMNAVFEYCRTDVMVEKAISDTIGHLPASELCTERFGLQLSDLTGGEVTSPTQAGKIKKFVNAQGFELEGCAKGLLEDTLRFRSQEMPDVVRQVIEIRLAAAKSSTAKYIAMDNCMGSEDRVRGTLAYHGADTGRWAGRLIQPQNFPRGTVKADHDELCNAVVEHDTDMIDMLYGNTMDVLATALRGAICAPAGREFIAADFSAVEARVGFWLAGDKEAVRVFEAGQDIYKDMAKQIYNVRYEDVTKDQRQVGKAAILGLGFQMGAERFQDQQAENGLALELDFCQSIVQAYRALHAPVKAGWYEIENAALSAVSTGLRVPFWNEKLCAFVEGDFLKLQLPSGRCISYYKPEVKQSYSEKFDSWSQKIHFMGTNSVTRQFQQQTTYGGKLTENVVQATARDLMRDSMVRLHGHPDYTIVMSVHDELVCEVDEGKGSVQEMEQLMATLAPWADGLPLEAEGWRGRRFRK